MTTRLCSLLCAAFCLLGGASRAGVVINEMMYHPPGAPENVAEEWIELHNSGAAPVNVSGWRLTEGVAFTIPPATSIPAAGFLIVAADEAAFRAANPGFSGQLVAGWTGRLSNSGERIRLDNAAGVKVSDVTYADEGDWALRVRGELSFGHRGWEWETGADGGGRTVELRNPALGPGSGQNWGESVSAGGTPGAANSVASSDIAPLIKGARHTPEIPRSTDAITVSCTIEDEAPGATATLYWRLDAGVWQALPMSDSDGDGELAAVIPPQADFAMIECYISATDGVHTRTWPAPARTSGPGEAPETFSQETNALVQVDDSFDPAADFTAAGNQPIYRLVMTEIERAELARIGSTSGEQHSDARMNGTFISHDGTGVKVRYLCSFRNRGFGSALGPPNNYNVSFPNSDRWNSRGSMGLNCQYVYSQALGQALFERAGLATQKAAIVKVRVNGADNAQAGNRMYGRYVRVEGRGGDWAERHYPHDSDGNFYRLDDHEYPQGDPRSGEFRFEGEDAEPYRDTFFKETNKDADDFSDLIEFARIVSAPVIGGTPEQPAISNADYPAAVATLLDLDQFYRFIATDAVVGNQEGGLQSGRADDASIYRGIHDTRFRFIPHDLDDVFDIGTGAGNPITRSIFSYDISGGGLQGLTRLFNHPQLVPRYYAAVLEALDTWFTRATIDPIIDQIMEGWVPLSDGNPASPNRGISEIKGFVDVRRDNLLSQIQQNYSLNVTGTAADTAEGFKVTSTGAATFSGVFNVARTYSITVNGQLAQWFYRAAGTDAAGTWRLSVPAGGGGILNPGLNRVVVRFWDGVDGAGNVLQELAADVFFGAPGAGTTITGALAPPGVIELTVPAGYVPGVPVLVRVDLKNLDGELNRGAWNSTVNLSATNGITLTPDTVRLFNGVGSALVSVGTGSGSTISIFSYGTGGTGSTSVNGVPGSQWRSKTDLTISTIGDIPETWKDEEFDDSTWPLVWTQTGYGNSDENQAFAVVDYNPTVSGTQRGPSYLFRNTFTLADLAQVSSVTGQIKYDDAYAIYVNGTRIARSNNLPLDSPLTSYATSTSSNNATANFTIPLALLKDGVNTIAVEIRQAGSSSSDVTFDLRLQAALSAADPGDFTLSATTSGLTATKAIASLFGSVETTAEGTLPPGITTWSGVVRVTGDVTVPTGATLNIEAGAHVLMAGNGTPGDTTGADIIVTGGAFAVNGTAAQPVSITCSEASSRWGQIYLNGATPTTANYLLMSRGGRAPGQGHTGRGPFWRLNGANLTLEDCTISDAPAKALYSQGLCDFVMRRSLMARMITGPETLDGTSLLIEDSNIQEILPHYRESNSPTPDDEDCLYVHNGSGRPVIVRRSVLALCGDDIFDGLGGLLIVEDCILREAWDKGMSLLNNDLTISRTLIVDCDKAIVPKSSTASTRTITVDRCTIVSENHDTTLAPWGYSIAPTAPDPDSPSTGLYTQNKSGQSHASAILAITATNSIIIAEAPILVDAPYDPANTVVNYSITRESAAPENPAWPGIGNLNDDPLFVSLATDDFRLTAESPAIDAGDPAQSDPDGSRADMGALPTGLAGGNVAPGEVRWTLAGSPYVVTANAAVPANITLRIDPGVSVHFAQNTRLTVNGRLIAQGAPNARIVFSHIPGTTAAGDCDPIKNGVQTGPPKWGGIRVVDSMAQESIVSHCDFINAQGTSPAGSENWGAIGFIRSWGRVDHCTWRGTHLRMCYGRNSKLTVAHNVFPDMFLFDPDLGRVEIPGDFLASADNNQEQLKVEYPTTDAQVAGNPAFPNGLPAGGHFRVYYNQFHGNRGHNDVFDADSGRWGQPGQFVLDCRYNHFHGVSGDEHIDLGGDAYIAGNVFERATKDQWTIDTGYSNAISSGDKGSGTTIMVVRNLFFDLDHAINCKLSTATIFEHNTVANFNPDYTYTFFTPPQNVKSAPINFFVPEDGSNPSYGDGAYMGFNLVSNVPRLFSGADARKIGGVVVNDITTKIEFHHNLLDRLGELTIGPNHGGDVFSGTYGPNTPGAAGFVDEEASDFSLRPDSLARGTAPGGFDYGASVPEWAYLLDGPIGVTAATSATFTVGGPGIVAYKWRLNGGAWSAQIQIGAGGVFPRGATATARQATLIFNGLQAGAYTLEILGQDMAGNWQDADPARTLIGAPQAAPTRRQWMIDPAFLAVRLNEISAIDAVLPDAIELHNSGSSAVTLTGWSLTDNPAQPNQAPLGAVQIAAGGYVTITSAALNLDRDGDAVYLYQNGVLRDSVSFGQQIPGKTIGRIGLAGAWTLCTPTFGAANVAVPVADFSQVRINEWLASASVLYGDDWIELRNLSESPAALEGLRVTDNRAGNAEAYIFPALSFIDGGGYLRLVASGGSTPGRLPFRFDAEQETISLVDAGGRLVDAVTFFPQTTDVSMGRDASGALSFYELPTRGFTNGADDPGYANALALLRGLRITEIMFNAIGGSDFDYVELMNIGVTPLELGGVHFVEGITFTFPARVLQPGEHVLVVKHLGRFRSRYGDAPAVAGVFGGQLDNGGETLALQLPPPFDANVLSFAYNDAWQPLTDGLGRSLVVLAPSETAAASWGDRKTWTASAQNGGDPAGASATPLTFSGWSALNAALSVTHDGDHDGVPALVEFGLGMNPADPRDGHGAAGLPMPGFSGGRAQLTFHVPENAAAVENTGFADVIYRVQAADSPAGPWMNIATKFFSAPWSGTGGVVLGAASNGYIPVTVQDPAAAGAASRFMRLQIQWSP